MRRTESAPNRAARSSSRRAVTVTSYRLRTARSPIPSPSRSMTASTSVPASNGPRRGEEAYRPHSPLSPFRESRRCRILITQRPVYSPHKSEPLLRLLDELRIIAQNGPRYAEGPYDRERCDRVFELVSEQYGELTDVSADEIRERLEDRLGHTTPNVGGRTAGIDEQGKLLVMRRTGTDEWGIQGGRGTRNPGKRPRKPPSERRRRKPDLTWIPSDRSPSCTGSRSSEPARMRRDGVLLSSRRRHSRPVTRERRARVQAGR